jgi:hypothetical protein
MGLRFLTARRLSLALASTILVAVTAPAARAQVHVVPGGPCPPSIRPYLGTPAPAPWPAPKPAPEPGASTDPRVPLDPGVGTTTETGAAAPTAPDLGGFASAAGGGESVSLARSGIAYLDSAIPATVFRLRFDSAWDNNRPDRAEFFYAKCGCLPGGPGPVLPETRVDYQDLRSYLEVALANRFSAFVEVPVRFLNPEQNANTAGLADINFGVKGALVYTDDTVLSFQFRTYVPTGDPDRGLGTDHVSLEPSLLLYRRLSERLNFEAQVGDWIPISGTDFAGNVIFYGVGLSYFVVDQCNFRIAPVAELFGWTVLDGKSSPFPENVVVDASGDSILNAKFGVRFGFGSRSEPGMLSGSDLYVGYGRALTGDVWYKDMFRVEYRLRF